MKSYFIYMLECSNGAYYTGYTTDISRRYNEHLNGSAKCKYTRSFPPKRIAVCWTLSTELSVVLKIEKFIKKLSSPEKHAVVNQPEILAHMLQQHLDLKDVSQQLIIHFSSLLE